MSIGTGMFKLLHRYPFVFFNFRVGKIIRCKTTCSHSARNKTYELRVYLDVRFVIFFLSCVSWCCGFGIL